MHFISDPEESIISVINTRTKENILSILFDIWRRLTKSIPPGFERCPVCGEFNGTTKAKYLNWEGLPPDDLEETITVSCLCKGILCRRCKKNKIHRPISNSYEEDSNTIDHWPSFSGMIPCSECRAKEKAKKSSPPHRSSEVNRGAEWRAKANVNKQQLRVLMCDDQKDLTDLFSTFINEATGNKYDLKIKSSPYADELLELTENGTFDIFILILNNIVFTGGSRIEKALQLVTHLRETYQKPIIALAGWPDDPSLAEKAKLAGANFFFRMPFKPKDFMEAIKKCLGIIMEK